jgi:hypothetical protein
MDPRLGKLIASLLAEKTPPEMFLHGEDGSVSPQQHADARALLTGGRDAIYTDGQPTRAELYNWHGQSTPGVTKRPRPQQHAPVPDSVFPGRPGPLMMPNSGLGDKEFIRRKLSDISPSLRPGAAEVSLTRDNSEAPLGIRSNPRRESAQAQVMASDRIPTHVSNDTDFNVPIDVNKIAGGRRLPPARGARTSYSEPNVEYHGAPSIFGESSGGGWPSDAILFDKPDFASGTPSGGFRSAIDEYLGGGGRKPTMVANDTDFAEAPQVKRSYRQALPEVNAPSAVGGSVGAARMDRHGRPINEAQNGPLRMPTPDYEGQGRVNLHRMADRFMKNGLPPAMAYKFAMGQIRTTGSEGTGPSLPALDPMRMALADPQSGAVGSAHTLGLGRNQNEADRDQMNYDNRNTESGDRRAVGEGGVMQQLIASLLQNAISGRQEDRTDRVVNSELGLGGGKEREAARAFMNDPQNQFRNPQTWDYYRKLLHSSVPGMNGGESNTAMGIGGAVPMTGQPAATATAGLSRNPIAMAQFLSNIADPKARALEEAKIYANDGVDHPSVSSHAKNWYTETDPDLVPGFDFMSDPYVLKMEAAKRYARDTGMPIDVAVKYFTTRGNM